MEESRKQDFSKFPILRSEARIRTTSIVEKLVFALSRKLSILALIFIFRTNSKVQTSDCQS